MNIWRYALILGLLSGCAPWPEHGQSGPGTSGSSPWPSVWNPTARESPATLQAQWERLKIRLEVLGIKDGQSCLPGHLRRNTILAERIGREIHAGLFGDAENNLSILRNEIRQMEQRIGYMTRHTQCAAEEQPVQATRPPPTPPVDQGAPKTSDAAPTLGNLLQNRVLFATGSSTLLPSHRKTLQEVAVVLLQHPEISLHITGHADNRGNEPYNQKLSEDRAIQARQILIHAGVPADRITVSGKGTTQPVADNQTRHGQLENRRIELNFFTTQPEATAPPATKTEGETPQSTETPHPIRKVKQWRQGFRHASTPRHTP